MKTCGDSLNLFVKLQMPRQSFTAAHLELRHRTYFAILYVPKDVRYLLNKTKFYKSTQTGDRRLAEQRAAAFVMIWQQEIDTARHNAEDPVIRSAMDLNSQRHRKDVSSLVDEVIDDETFKIRNAHGNFTADVFNSIATGDQPVLETFFNPWKEHQIKRGLKPKTIDKMCEPVKLLISSFPTPNTLTFEYITGWIRYIAPQMGLTAQGVKRHFEAFRNFYAYLQSKDVVSRITPNPFLVPDEFRISNKPNSKSLNKSSSWIPFLPEDIVSLYAHAKTQEDEPLATLILLGAYTGARIEELCSLKSSQVSVSGTYFTITDAKTKAGNRVVPIHPKINESIIKLLSESTDDYLLSGLTENKYGDRSNAIGKRFGRLKTKYGFHSKQVFHSIRKTFITMMENAGISENLTADIVGHEKPRITYGLYSGGATLPVMREAILKISYPFIEQPIPTV